MLKGTLVAGLMCMGCALVSTSALAECRINDSFSTSTHGLVTGTVNNAPESEVFFKVPGADVGNNVAVAPDSVDYPGTSRTLDKHLRFRVRVKNKSSTGVRMEVDSSTPLSCLSCSSSVDIPFTAISWTEGVASETRGTTSGDGQFNGSVQNLIYAVDGTDNLFNLQFNFANDEVYPAGTYRGAFVTRGIPQ